MRDGDTSVAKTLSGHSPLQTKNAEDLGLLIAMGRWAPEVAEAGGCNYHNDLQGQKGSVVA